MMDKNNYNCFAAAGLKTELTVREFTLHVEALSFGPKLARNRRQVVSVTTSSARTSPLEKIPAGSLTYPSSVKRLSRCISQHYARRRC